MKQELIAELEITGNPAILTKQGLGTYACLELETDGIPSVKTTEGRYGGPCLDHVPDEWKGATSVVGPGGRQKMAIAAK